MITFGNRIELLVDRYLIDQSDNLTFRTQPPKDCGCVIAFSQPWECPGSLSMTVLDDGKQIKQYYRGFPSVQNDASDRQTSCLSVSDDGLNFTPYPVNEISYDGITENNIIRMDTFCHNFAPFYDTNPACKPDERYKAIGGQFYNYLYVHDWTGKLVDLYSLPTPGSFEAQSVSVDGKTVYIPCGNLNAECILYTASLS
jgi:hypothetical protein